MPGIRYSLGESESGRTIVLEQGEIVEINLRWAPGIAWNWDVPVSGCAIELLNDGYYDTGTDYWNQSGHYRARYRATRPGRSFIDGVFGIAPGGPAHAWNPRFNLTVIVK
jgi:predicted secreted protein